MRRLALATGLVLAATCGGGGGGGGATTSTPSTPTTPTTPTTPEPKPRRDTSALQAAIERGILPPVQVKGDEARTTLADLMAKHRIQAMSIAVFENYELVWAHAYGLADATTKQAATEATLFQAGSISKSVNALGVLSAVADGTLSLDAPINEQLTSWKLPDSELSKKEPVTIRRLLSHTAGTTVHGFPGYADGTPVPTLVQILDGLPPANTAPIRVDLTPGEKFRYSGGGTSITQLALVDKLGAPYPTILRDRVLSPLGMKASTYEQPLPPDRVAQAAAGYRGDGSEVPGKRHVYPEMAAAGLWTTPSDLARFFIEIARARAGTSKLVSREIAMQMTTPVTEKPPVGLGVFISDRNGTATFGHGGADEGFQANVVTTLDGGNGVVVMVNSDSGFLVFPAIERTVFGTMGWKGADPVIERAPLPAEQLAAIAGRYMSVENLVFTVAVKGDRLTITRPFGEPGELVPLGGDRFVSTGDGAPYKLDSKGNFEVRLGGGLGTMALAVRLNADATAPLFELEAGRFDAAVANWKKRIKKSKEMARTLEEFHNLYGYDMLRSGNTDAAVTILRAIVAVYPDSSNAYDSLGEALMAAGDKAGAIKAYETAIKLLAKDARIPPAERAARKTHGESQLAILRKAR